MISEVAKNVYWIGVVAWTLSHFHGHELSTHRGSTYNSYLIVDEEIVVVDTVWGPYRKEFMNNIREILDPSKIGIVVANHSESDHSGGLPALMEHAPNAMVVVSQRGRESGEGH